MEKEERVKMTVEIPRALWKRARMRAIEEERDLREIVIDSLERYLGEEPRRKGKTK